MMLHRTLLAVLLALSLTACEQARVVGTSDTNHIPYEKYGIMRMKVAEVKVVEDYQPTYHAPNVEHQLLTPPYTALRNWAQNRFEAIGTVGIARVEILDASIVQKDKPVVEDTLFGQETNIETEFDVRLRVRIQIDSPIYIDLPYAETTVIRRIKFDEQTTAADHLTLLQNVVAEAVDTQDTAMTKTLHEKWGSIVE